MNYRVNVILLSIILFIHDGQSKGGGRGGGGGGSRGGGSRGGGKVGSSGGSSGRGWGGSGGSRTFSRGSISSSTSRSIAAGVAGGFVGYQGGKVARRISSSSYYMYYPTYNRNYYYGERYYTASDQTSDQKCIYQIESGDDYFDLTYEDNGSRVTEIIYNCGSNEDCCDGLDCCNGTLAWWAILLILVAVLTVLIFICVLISHCRRKVKDKDNSTAIVMNPVNYDNQQCTINQDPQGPTFVSSQQHMLQDRSSTFVPTSMQLGNNNSNGQFESGYPVKQNIQYATDYNCQMPQQHDLHATSAFIPTHMQINMNNPNCQFGLDYNQVNTNNDNVLPPPAYSTLK